MRARFAIAIIGIVGMLGGTLVGSVSTAWSAPSSVVENVDRESEKVDRVVTCSDTSTTCNKRKLRHKYRQGRLGHLHKFVFPDRIKKKMLNEYRRNHRSESRGARDWLIKFTGDFLHNYNGDPTCYMSMAQSHYDCQRRVYNQIAEMKRRLWNKTTAVALVCGATVLKVVKNRPGDPRRLLGIAAAEFSFCAASIYILDLFN